ncbi:ubiquitin carboxyl-terminal hydrolase 21 isoform X1 [Amborella trichopoda]|uniref:ubiquitin carboxyl-terminal hydrolase 21 isoform X1 n=1 Tax=Amborella trichopoda TaxID=13333 RepID=UPI0005D39B58|nr:ubiquitin carboxyl-terminal hydrolase 21 isoform X1 [Amborella trichopoda]|eukprot:XP_011621708.1 ubiquitin carboxyl-terminal hydrolase 21 isoform X1 [Amborella trichopoda]
MAIFSLISMGETSPQKSSSWGEESPFNSPHAQLSDSRSSLSDPRKPASTANVAQGSSGSLSSSPLMEPRGCSPLQGKPSSCSSHLFPFKKPASMADNDHQESPGSPSSVTEPSYLIPMEGKPSASASPVASGERPAPMEHDALEESSAPPSRSSLTKRDPMALNVLQERPCSSFYSFMDYRPPSPMGAGLVNLGNTCFMNAVMQCITHTAPLLLSLQTCSHVCPGESDGFCALCYLREHVDWCLSRSGGCVHPRYLVENLNKICSSFEVFQQEDAHEFLHCFLDKLHECVKPPNASLSRQSDSFVTQIFGGHIRSRVRCHNCGHCSDTYESSLGLSLEIDEAETLYAALKSFTKVETIDDPEVKFGCDGCKQQVSVEKQLALDQAPAVATFHLKRFQNDGSNVEKVCKFVEYPLELDLQPFICSSQSDTDDFLYDLYAVLVHSGNSYNYGHYFCFICSSPDSWHRLDDTQVRRSNAKYVLNQEAYILFYKRRGVPWFSNLMETQRKCEEINHSSSSPKSVLEESKVSPPRPEECSSSGSDTDVATTSISIPACPMAPHPLIPSMQSKHKEDHAKDHANQDFCHAPMIPRSVNLKVGMTPMPTSQPKESSSTPESLPKESLPITQSRSKESLLTPGPRPNESPVISTSVKKLLDKMPMGRRSGLTRCLMDSEPRSDGALMNSKKRKVSSSSPPWKLTDLTLEERNMESGVSYPGLSPRSLRRACSKAKAIDTGTILDFECELTR